MITMSKEFDAKKIIEAHENYYPRLYSIRDHVIVKGEGAYLYDAQGNKYFKEKKYDLAISVYEEAVNNGDTSFEAFYNLAYIYYYEKKDFNYHINFSYQPVFYKRSDNQKYFIKYLEFWQQS